MLLLLLLLLWLLLLLLWLLHLINATDALHRLRAVVVLLLEMESTLLGLIALCVQKPSAVATTFLRLLVKRLPKGLLFDADSRR